MKRPVIHLQDTECSAIIFADIDEGKIAGRNDSDVAELEWLQELRVVGKAP